MAPAAGSLSTPVNLAVVKADQLDPSNKSKSKAQSTKNETKKKRNANPGTRVQGGRIYDSENGTTCHQCRQKTVEIKAKCKTCTLYFCPRCLSNRYNEQVDVVNKLPEWSCPKCRKTCNCSNCRKKAGLEATGILANVAKTAGFGSVSELLKKNPKAKALSLMNQSSSQQQKKGIAKPKQSTASGTKRKAAAVDQLIDDSELPPRQPSFPEGASLALYKSISATKSPSASSKRSRGPAWLDKVPEVTKIPTDVDSSKLSCILEFVSTFGSALMGQQRTILSLPAIAAELVQPAALRRADQLCPVPEDSIAASLHSALLQTVRTAWGVRGPPVGLAAWQDLMRPYYAAQVIPTAAASLLRKEDGPPAVAGEFINRGMLQDGSSSEEEDLESGMNSATFDSNENDAIAYRNALAAAAQVQFPKGGFWGVSPDIRVNLLYELLHDALDTYILRGIIDKAMEEAAEVEKERRSEVADVRRAAREAATKQRDREIALLIAESAGKSMTLEEQRAMMEQAKEKAEAAVAAASAAKVKSLSSAVMPPTVRTAPLGQDRDDQLVFKLHSGPILTGSSKGLVVCNASGMKAYAEPAKVLDALDPKGKSEGSLRHAISRACGMPLSPSKGAGKRRVEKKALVKAVKSPVTASKGVASAATTPKGTGPCKTGFTSAFKR